MDPKFIMTRVLRKRRNLDTEPDMHKGRMIREDEGRNQGGTFIS